MHGSLLAVSFGLVATFSWGFADFFGAKVSKKLGGYHSAFLVSVLATVTYGLIFGLLLRKHIVFDWSGIVYAVVAGAIFTIAMTSFYKGLEVGPVSIVSPLGSLYPLVTTLLLVLLFGNHLTLRQETGIVVVVLGILAATGLFKRTRSNRRLSIGPFLGLLAALCWGTNFALLAQSIDRVGWQFATLIQQSVSTLTFLIVLPIVARGGTKLFIIRPSYARNKFLMGAGLLQVVGFLATTIGIGHVGHLAAIVVAVSACYPVITVTLALRHLNEHFEPIPILGALTSVAGIVILSLG